MENIYKALLAVQGDLKAVIKAEPNPFFKSKYFDINAVVAMLRPIITQHGLVVLQPLTEMNGKPAIETILLDKSGEMLSRTTPLIESNDAQKWGGIITYTRRYALTSLFLIEGEEDDDAQSATPAKQTQPSAAQKPTAYPNVNAAPSDSWASFVLPFGKHKGKSLGEADPSYLSWLSGTEIKNPALASALAGWSAAQNPAQELPTIKIEEREREEWKPPVVDDGDVPLSDIPL